MILIAKWLSFSSIILLGAMIPGASFVQMVRAAICESRRYALAVATGLGLGMLLHVCYLFPFFSYIQESSGWLLQAIAILGAIYLFYLGCRSLKAARSMQPPSLDGRSDDEAQASSTWSQGLIRGFVTDAFNPKIVIFSLALIGQFMSAGTSSGEKWLFATTMVLIHWLWFSFVGLSFSSPKVRGVLVARSRLIESLSGGALLLLSAATLASGLHIL